MNATATTALAFKRIAKNTRFSFKGDSFLKKDNHTAMPYRADGKGQPGIRVSFSRSAMCQVMG